MTLAFANAVAVGDTAVNSISATQTVNGATANSSNSENANNNARNNTVYALLAKYNAGPVNVGLNVHRIAPGAGVTIATGINSIDNYTLAGAFDAKVVKLHALASYNAVDAKATLTDFTGSNYMLGLSVPVGKATIKTSVNFSDYNGERNSAFGGGTAVQYAVGGTYDLSKRTNLYTTYAFTDAQDARRTTVSGMNDAMSNGGTAGSGNPYQQGFQVGVRHQF